MKEIRKDSKNIPELKDLSQEEIWDKIAGRWEEFRKNPILEVQEFLKKQKGRVLDLGCGTGRNFIKNNKIELYGLDFSKEMLKHAEEKIKRDTIKAYLIKSEFTKLPFQDNLFNAAIFIRSLHCIPDERDREKALKELYRVLKPSSKAFIEVCSKNHERIKHKESGKNVPWTINGERVFRYYYIYKKEEIENLVKKVGFKILSVKEDKNISLVVEKE